MKAMKHVLTAIMAAATLSSAYAQVGWTVTGNNVYNAPTTSKVGIGLTSVSTDYPPYFYSAQLQVKGRGGFQYSSPLFPVPVISISGSNATGTMDFSVLNSGGSISTNYGALQIIGSGVSIVQPPQTYSYANLSVPNGIVTIGNVTAPFITVSGHPSGGYYNYGLYVGGGILTEKIKVAVSGTSNWADYVFDKNYKLLTLSEVEAYVIKNKHLPGVPSAKEVVADGIDVVTMDAKLLEKIEELTLYMIELKNKNLELEKKINEMQIVLKQQ